MTSSSAALARLALLSLTVLLASGCKIAPVAAPTAAPSPSSALGCRDGETTMRRTTLYFGAAIPNSTDTVDASEWQGFLDASVTPRFPDGLTWFEARGQWRGADGRVIGEPSRVLIVLHADDMAAAAAIDAIRDDYKTAFEQEAVMRERSMACVAF